MDILITILLAIVNAANGIAGFMVGLKKRSDKARTRFSNSIVTLSIVGVVLVGWQAQRASQSSEESKKNLLGDAERPPFVSVISLPGVTRFVTTNNSDYPAYGIKIQLFDGTNRSTPIRSYDYPEMAAHVAVLDDKPWIPADSSGDHRFTAQISTRTGVVFEELILRQAGNNQWMRASRVQQGMKTLEQDVDSAWPRDEHGQVDWR